MSSNANAKDKQKKKSTGRWSKEQHQRFMMGIVQYGKDWKKVQQVVGTRSGSQVRSHAQKFFNRIKIEEGSQQPHKQPQASQSQNDFKNIIQEQQSINTPFEIVSLIKKQSKDNTVNVNNFKKALQKNEMQVERKIQQKTPQKCDKSKELSGLNSFKSMSNILKAYQNVTSQDPKQFQQQSFLLLLTKKYKKYFSNCNQFQKLIDFGNKQDVVQVQKAIRKKSFTLVEGQESDDEKLQQIKKNINSPNQAEKETLNQGVKQILKQQLEQIHGQLPKQSSQKKQEKQNNQQKQQNGFANQNL